MSLLTLATCGGTPSRKNELDVREAALRAVFDIGELRKMYDVFCVAVDSRMAVDSTYSPPEDMMQRLSTDNHPIRTLSQCLGDTSSGQFEWYLRDKSEARILVRVDSVRWVNTKEATVFTHWYADGTTAEGYRCTVRHEGGGRWRADACEMEWIS